MHNRSPEPAQGVDPRHVVTAADRNMTGHELKR